MSDSVADAQCQRYSALSREQLIGRIEELEKTLQTKLDASQNSNAFRDVSSLHATRSESTSRANIYQAPIQQVDGSLPEKKSGPRPFDIESYPCRKIALRFSYDGAPYSGLEIQPPSASSQKTPIATVEGELWKALCSSRLVDDQVGMNGVGWSRCGRTDRGVSAAGQVVAFWVRSKRVDEWNSRRALDRLLAERQRDNNDGDGSGSDDGHASKHDDLAQRLSQAKCEEEHTLTKHAADPEKEEIDYVSVLNRILPSTIQVQAWSPVPATFSARFDCRYRHYKYFFTEGAPFRLSTQSTARGGVRLDIQAMRQAAQRFLGEHDFRNFCKIDGSKQITNYRRRIDGVSIDVVDRGWPREMRGDSERNPADCDERMFVLNLRGTAFLYHQVRHIVAVLFLVGAGLEKASIVDELLNVEQGRVYTDRLSTARTNGLVLEEDGIQKVLPGSSATNVDGATSLAIAKAAQLEHTQHLNLQASELVKDGIMTAEQQHKLEVLQHMYVFDRKPVYEMAADRPLMLWECGFRPTDIQWRSGSYDGPLESTPHATLATEAEHHNTFAPAHLDINSSTIANLAQSHSLWTQNAISTEMYRHFLLALPCDPADGGGVGFIPASTRFDHASFPSLESSSIPLSAGSSAQSSTHRLCMPLGNGRTKNVPSYTTLHNVYRQETPDEKNKKWRETRGARRKAKLTVSEE